MNCVRCNAPLEEGAQFCSECGERVAVQVNRSAPSDFSSSAQPDFAANENGNAYYGANNGNYQSNVNNGSYSQYSDAGSAYGNNAYQQYPNYSSSPYGYPTENNKAPEVKDYLKWMLLYPLLNFIPGIGFIIYVVICIKHAFDNQNKGRSNFFKAILVSMIASIVVMAVVMIVIFGVLGVAVGTGLEYFEEMYPEVFSEFEAAGGYYPHI